MNYNSFEIKIKRHQDHIERLLLANSKTSRSFTTSYICRLAHLFQKWFKMLHMLWRMLSVMTLSYPVLVACSVREVRASLSSIHRYCNTKPQLIRSHQINLRNAPWGLWTILGTAWLPMAIRTLIFHFHHCIALNFPGSINVKTSSGMEIFCNPTLVQADCFFIKELKEYLR
jgi:hypothetical protein